MPFSVGFGVGPLRWSHRLGGGKKRPKKEGPTLAEIYAEREQIKADLAAKGVDWRKRLATNLMILGSVIVFVLLLVLMSL